MITATDPAAAVPRPITVGPQMAVLARFYPDVAWTGTITAGGMGPGTPEMTAHGRGSQQLIQDQWPHMAGQDLGHLDGRWIVGTYSQEQYLSNGTHVLTWQLHWVVGWDPDRAEYRATLADCYGHAEVMRGRIDGDRLTFESVTDRPVRIRLTWDAANPADITWRNEASIDGETWTLIETYHMTPTPS